MVDGPAAGAVEAGAPVVAVCATAIAGHKAVHDQSARCNGRKRLVIRLPLVARMPGRPLCRPSSCPVSLIGSGTGGGEWILKPEISP